MKTRTWNIPLVTFLSGGNTVILKNKKELEEFINQMALMGIDVSTLTRTDASKGLLVEFDNGKGTTFWNYDKTMEQAIEASKEWYEMDPFKWEDIKVLPFATIQDEYWKQKILQEAESIECEVTPKRTEEIITTFLNDDSVWYTVEESIRYYLKEEK
jgi:hypothetical protein